MNESVIIIVQWELHAEFYNISTKNFYVQLRILLQKVLMLLLLKIPTLFAFV